MFCLQKKFLKALIFFICYISIKANDTTIITHQEQIDLGIFSNPTDENTNLFDILNRTVTQQGQKALKDILQNPLKDIAQLEKRQYIIKQLISDQKLAEQIEAELQRFKQSEAVLDTFWQPQDPVLKTALEEFYFTNSYFKHLNSNPKLLNGLQAMHITSMFAPVIEHLISHFFISKALSEWLHMNCNHSHHHHDHDHSHADPFWALVYKVYNVAHMGVHVMGVKSLYDHMKQKGSLIKSLQANLIQANNCLKSLNALYKILGKSVIMQNLTHFDALNNLFTNQNLDPDSALVLKLLSKSTFSSSPSLFSNIGNVLAAHSSIGKAQELHASLAALGEIDAYLSIAKLYKEFEDKPTQYSFALYQESQKPFIQAHHYWNPNILQKHINLNDITLGQDKPNTVVITGSNAAGKSTNLKALSLLILLGQTFTIVPATQCMFTPFTKISIFITHKDNIEKGNSLFISEMNKANAFVDALQHKLQPHDFSFVVFDELFKSTECQKGQDTAYSLIKFLTNFSNNMCIVSTHYPKLTELEAENVALCKNYTAKVYIDSQGRPLYSLVPGSSLPSQAFDVIEAQGIQGIWNTPKK